MAATNTQTKYGGLNVLMMEKVHEDAAIAFRREGFTVIRHTSLTPDELKVVRGLHREKERGGFAVYYVHPCSVVRARLAKTRVTANEPCLCRVVVLQDLANNQRHVHSQQN